MTERKPIAEPPPGVPTLPVDVVVPIESVGFVLTVLVRRTWLPAGVTPDVLRFPDLDPDRRLPVIQDLGVTGVSEYFGVTSQVWDYTDATLAVRVVPIQVDPELSEESVGLVIGLFREAGWDYRADKDREWPAHLVAARDTDRRERDELAAQDAEYDAGPPPFEGPIVGFNGVAHEPEPDHPADNKKRRRRRTKPKDTHAHEDEGFRAADEDEEPYGSPGGG